MKSSTILVTDATRNLGLAVIRELGRAGLDVRGADSRRLPLNLHSRYSPAYLDYGATSGLGLSEALLDLVETLRPEVLLPLSTPATHAVCKHRELFELRTNVLVPTYDAFLTAMDNERTLRTCNTLGIPCPQILTRNEAAQILAEKRAPSEPGRVVVKPKLDLGAARGVRYVASKQGLEAGITENSRWYGDSVVQEYIPGDTSAMRVVLLLFNRSSELIGHFTARKILQWPETGGVTAVAESTHEPELVKLVVPFFEHLDWQGLAEVELKLDPRDGLPKVIEVNPRTPSYMGFPERCNIPISRMMVEAARNESHSPICPSYPAGVRFLRTGELLKIILHRLGGNSSQEGTLGQVWTEINAGTRPASQDFTDPAPRLGKVLFELLSLAGSSDFQEAVPDKD